VLACLVRRRPALRDLKRLWGCRFDGRWVFQISLCFALLVPQWLSSVSLKKSVNVSIPVKEFVLCSLLDFFFLNQAI